VTLKPENMYLSFFDVASIFNFSTLNYFANE
jgi:hypothetical protein